MIRGKTALSFVFATALLLGGICYISPAQAEQPQSSADAAAILDVGECPDTASGFEMSKVYACDCPANSPEGTVWGSDVYTDDSNICAAAVHAGAVKKDAGGHVVIRILQSPPVFKGTTRNEIKSQIWLKPMDSAFEFVPGK